MRNPATLIGPVLLASLTLTACNSQEPEPETVVTPTPEPTPSPISILRESPKPVVDDLPMEPLEITVPFAEGGYLLSEAAEEAVAEIVASEQFKMGGLIVLRGHTDSVGNDRANLKASERRAQAVADALEEQGASSENIEIIGIGEMRPIAPNAKLDGTPHEEGRAKNRRVDVTIEPPELEDDPVPESSDPAAGPTPSPT